MYRRGQAISVCIEPTDVTAGLVKTHQAMNGRYLFECRIDGAMRIRNRQALDTYADERSQPRLSTLNDQIL